MFCTTECWDCNDMSCKHFISKSSLYFENVQLHQRIDKTLKYIENQKKKMYKNRNKIALFNLIKIEEILGEKK